LAQPARSNEPVFREELEMIEANIFLEKRTSPRISLKIPIKFQSIDDRKEIKNLFDRHKKDQTAQTIDISLSGMYIMTDHALNTGSILRIDILIRDLKSALTTFAEVVWANETGGGLRFLTMKDEDREILRNYLDKLSYPSGG
jgi:hypothetical protein